jgi:hypothetical protein
MPSRTEAQIAEITRLRAETLALLAWFERTEPAPVWADMREVVTKAESSLPKMRAIAKELRSVIGGMPEDLRDAVLAAVQADSGISLVASDTADAKKAEAIYRRGKVSSEAEYYRLRTHLERVSNTPGREADVSRIVAILDAYSPSGRAAT